MAPDTSDIEFTGREWVLEAVDCWLSASELPRFFLLTGVPGSGKTAIARRLEQLSRGRISEPSPCSQLNPGFLAAAHYCSARQASSIDAQSFARSLSLRLAKVEPRFAQALVRSRDPGVQVDVRQNVGSAESVVGVIVENLDLSGLSALGAFSAGVIRPLECLELRSEDAPPSLIVLIDALDEALVDSHISILDLLAALDEVPRWIRFIVTSRPIARVQAALLDKVEKSLSSGACKELSHSDVARYIDQRVHRNLALSSLLLASATASVETIAAKADGNFLYARLLLDDLSARRQDPDMLERLPVGLDGFFHDSLQRAVRAGSGQWISAYAPVVGTLSVAREPIDRPQIQRFTGQPASVVWACLDKLEQFIETSHVSSGASVGHAGTTKQLHILFHQSLRDFLLQEFLHVGTSEIRNSFFLDPLEWNDRIVESYRSADSWEQVDWKAVDDYGLRHLPYHLFHSHMRPELLVLVSSSFLTAKIRRLHSYRAVRDDLTLALEAANRASDLPAVLRVALIQAGLRVRAGTIEWQVPLYALVGEVERAMDLAEIVPAKWKRAVTLRAIVAALALVDTAKARQVAEQIDDLEARVESFVIVFKAYLRLNMVASIRNALVERILGLMDTSTWRSWQSHLLLEMSMALWPLNMSEAERMLNLALNSARQEADPLHRYERLRDVAQLCVVRAVPDAHVIYGEAIDALELVSLGQWRAEHYANIIDELASIDLSSAINRSRLTDAFCRIVGLVRSARHLAIKDLSGARALLAEAEQGVDKIEWSQEIHWGWRSDSRKLIASARKVLEPISLGQITVPEPPTPNPSLVPWETPDLQALPQMQYHSQIEAALAGDVKENEFREIVQRCVAVGDRETARELVRSAIRRSSDTSEFDWTSAARAVLIGAIAASDSRSALELVCKYSGPVHSAALAAIVVAVAETNLRQAMTLLHDSTLEDTDKADALGGILRAAARMGDTQCVLSYLRLLKDCGSPPEFLDLKCDEIATASGLVARHNAPLAVKMLRWVIAELSGDPQPIGFALSRIGNADPHIALKLQQEAGKAILNSSKSPDEKAEGLAVLGRALASFSPERALSVVRFFAALEPGYLSGVFSAAARHSAKEDVSRARQLRDQAIHDAERAFTTPLKVEALVQIVEDCSEWDRASCEPLIQQAVELSRSHQSPVVLVIGLAKAASVLLLLGQEERAASLLCEACGYLNKPESDESQLEEIVKTCQRGSAELAASITVRVIRAMTEASTFSPDFSGIHEWLDKILLLLLHAATNRSQMAGHLLKELDIAIELVDQVFLG